MQASQISPPSTDPALEDRRLIEQCLAGDQGAWDELYHRCQPTILSTARAVLSPRADACEVSDEIAARVWVQLISDNCRLLRQFDAQRQCRLQTYVAKICRNQTLNYRRAERRRRSWEILLADSSRLESTDPQPLPEDRRVLPEAFLANLTPREREFCDTYLFAVPDSDHAPEYSATNIRQLRCRLHRKLKTYLAGET